MCLLHLFIILLSGINIGNCQSIAFEFASKDINDSENYVNFIPKPNVSFDTGLTICFRVKFEFWNLKTVFFLEKIQLNISPYFHVRATVRLEDIWLNVEWPEPRITTATAWFLFHQLLIYIYILQK